MIIARSCSIAQNFIVLKNAASLFHCLPVLPRLRRGSLVLLSFIAISAGRAGELLSAPAVETNAIPESRLNSWPQWRGPLANGLAPAANPPIHWSETNNIRWKITLPGKGHSSPVIFGNHIYLLTAAPVGEAQKPVYDDAPGVHDSTPVTHTHQFMAVCISRADGKIVWLKILKEEWPHEGGHVTGSLASNSPVTDGEFLFVFFGSRGLYCLTLNGEIKWQKDLGRMHTLHAHGEGSSPVLYKEALIVCWDDEKNSFLYAFNKCSGE